MNNRISESLYQRATKSMVGGVNSPVRAFKSVGGNPIFIQKAQAQYIYSADGQKLLDFVGSYGPAILGHAHPDVVKALQEALSDGFCFGASSEKEIVLSELVKEAFPHIDLIRMVNSGTEAVMSAIRLARGYTGKKKLVKFSGNYHGHVDALMAQAGSGLATQGLPGSAGINLAVVSDTLVVPYNDINAVETLFSQFGDDIAAIICEPVCGNIGVVLPNDGFLQRLRTICDKNNALLIFDEVMTGFRAHFGGVQHSYSVIPDITVLGKIIGGGLPVGAYGARTEIMERIAPLGDVYQAGTLSGNPIAMTAGIVTLSLLKNNPEWYSQTLQKTETLKNGFITIAHEKGIPITVNTYGTMITPFFTSNTVTDYATAQQSDLTFFNQFFWHMLESGFFLPPSQFEAWFLNFAMTDSDIDSCLSAFKSL